MAGLTETRVKARAYDWSAEWTAVGGLSPLPVGSDAMSDWTVSELS